MEEKTDRVVRYTYVRDPKDNRRFVTIAWILMGSSIRYAVAVNRVEKSVDGIVEFHKKEDGRRTAFGRLNKVDRRLTYRNVDLKSDGNIRDCIPTIVYDVLRADHENLSPAMRTARGVFGRAFKKSLKSKIEEITNR